MIRNFKKLFLTSTNSSIKTGVPNQSLQSSVFRNFGTWNLSTIIQSDSDVNLKVTESCLQVIS